MSNSSDPAATPAAAPAAPDTFDAQQAIYDALVAKLDERNKTALFDVLSAASISHVTVRFDGYGDSGQIEDVEARAGEEAVEPPAGTIAIALANWGDLEAEARSMTIAAAIERLCYDFLERTHCGWENNDGADGDFVFDVAARSITLDYNEHYSASENYTHTF